MPTDQLTSLLQKVFKIRKGEFGKTALMFLYAFNAVAAFIIGRIMKDTLFLSDKTNLTWLPYMYIFVALGVSLATVVYARQIARFSLSKVINVSMASFIIILLAFRYALTFENITWVVSTMYIFIEIMGIMLIIQFWTFANEIYNSREAKRLFGVIGGGQVLANLYSFPIKNLKEYIGIPNLLFVCIVSIIFCWFVFNYLSKNYHLTIIQRGRGKTIKKQKDKLSPTSVKGGVFASLQKHIWMLSTITILAATFIDYQFKVTAGHLYKQEDLADFLFTIYAWCGVLACLIQFFVTGRLIEKLGILWALIVLPLAIFSGSILTLGALGLVGFMGITLTKGGELVTRYTITETTTQILYQPLPQAMRRSAKAIADGIMRPVAQVLGGILLIGLNYFFYINEPSRIHEISWITLFLVVGWVGILVSTRHKYVESLLVSNDRHARSAGMESEEDERSLALSRAVIQRALATDDDVQILNALEVLPMTRWPDWDDHVLPLLKSPFARVRVKALDYLGKSENRKYSRHIHGLFNDSDDQVRATAIQVFCLLEHDRAVPLISKYLEEPSALVKAATITGLICYGGLDGILSSTSELKKMLDTENPSERELGAKVLGYIKIQSFYQPLFRLINDNDVNVQRAAIEAAGQMLSKELVPNLIYKLQFPDTQPASVKALAIFGEDLLPSLESVLLLDNVSPRIRQSIPLVLADIEAPRSFEILEELLESKDTKLRSAAMRAMQKLYARLEEDVTPDYSRVQRALHAELESYFQFLVHMKTIQEYNKGSGDLLVSTLGDYVKETLERAFYLLGIIYPLEQIEIVSYNLRSENPAIIANASEIVDNIVDAETKRYLLPILDTLDSNEKVNIGKDLFKLQEYSSIDLLRRILFEDSDCWLVACAIYMIGDAKITKLRNDVKRFIYHEDPVVRETVLFALFRLSDDKEFNHIAGMYAREKNDTVKAYLDSLFAS